MQVFVVICKRLVLKQFQSNSEDTYPWLLHKISKNHFDLRPQFSTVTETVLYKYNLCKHVLYINSQFSVVIFVKIKELKYILVVIITRGCT